MIHFNPQPDTGYDCHIKECMEEEMAFLSALQDPETREKIISILTSP